MFDHQKLSSRRFAFLKNKEWFIHRMWKAEYSSRKDKSSGMRHTGF